MDIKEIKSEHLNGIYSELAKLIGVEAAMKIHETYRGQQVTLPVNFLNRKFTALLIAKEYDGHNIKSLATKYGYSEKSIRKILKRMGEGQS